MSKFSDLLGTIQTKFQLGIGGLYLKSSASKIRARNSADSADMPIVGSIVGSSGDSIEINEDAAGSGADWKMRLLRPTSGMTAALDFTFPATAGSPNQALVTDGSGIFSFATVAGGTDKAVTDTTSLAFGTSSPLTLFTLPANAIVTLVQVIVDTPFSGGTAPTLSIGISGTTSKYMGATQNDLTAAAGTVFEVTPGLASVGSTEALIATYAANSSTAGAARILVTYVIPS